MNTMYILMSHTITEQQMEDAKRTLHVQNFIILPTDEWSQIPAEGASVESSLLQLKAQLVTEAHKDDILLVQGDFGATYSMVQFAKEIDIIPVYATTKRLSREIVEGEKITIIREFKHVRFRKY